MPEKRTRLIFVFSALVCLAFLAPARAAANQPQLPELSTEVFQVLDLPVTVHQASLLKADRGYFLKLSLANTSDEKIIGLRYSLATIDSENRLQLRVNRTEGFSIAPYSTKTLTFKTPIKLKTNGERLVLMLEQVISRESIWEVVKAKEAFESYAKGDYSVRPVVLRVANQVDVPPFPAQPLRRN